MQNKKILIVYIILIILIPTIIFPVNSQSENSTYWDKNWLYKQEIILPISTELSISKYQPIDIGINFNNNCWANNEKEHSIRVICKKDNNYYELESQIYDLEYKNVNILQKCGLIFLIPEFANGNEKYYVYYDNTKKTAPNYLDHVKIEDTYYYYEPISGISAEGDYYKIIEDDYIVFGIGQKGNVINRWLSQAVVKLKPKTEKFDIANSDNMASFAFSYHIGTEDEDEFSSDQKLVSKNIRIDGNLMIEFAIISESENKELRTTCIYRYYYCPTEDKKISAHVKHEIMAEGTVKGIENVDGRFGAILSYQSKSSRIPAMRFGEIKPYLHVYGEDGKIKEYYLDSNPENNKREWIISYSDDCDIGSGSWLSYDEGTKGKAQGIIFSSNEDIIRYGTDERDGIQIKLAEKEILDVLGAEIDYAAISFGRNSYEKGGKHDLKIPKGLLVEYDVEYYITEDGGYNKISEEAKIFKELIKHRKNNQGQYEADTNINTLRVIPRLSGRILTNPLLANITGWDIFKLTVELYQGEEFISKGEVYKPLFGAPRINFPKLAKGDYIVKIFKKIGKTDKKIIGLATVKLEQDETIDVICTWQKDYKISLRDQNNQNIKNANLEIFSNDEIQIESKISNEINKTIFSLPFNLFDPYVLRVFYKGFKIYDDKLSLLDGKIDIILPLYDLEIIVRDELNFPPNVNLKPILLATANDLDTEINAINLGKGKFLFENIPNSSYKLIISFGK